MKNIEEQISRIERGQRLHIPLGISCNNNCIFCMEPRERSIFKTVSNNAKAILETNKKFKEVLFTEGEPTLNPELFKIIGYAKEIGYDKIGLMTNGRLLSSAKFVKRLIYSGINSIIVSVHGPNRKIHDALTRAPGSFEQTRRGLKNLHKLKKKLDFNLETNTVLCNSNYKHIAEMLDFLFLFDLDRIHLNVVYCRGRAAEKIKFLTPPYSEIVKRFCEEIKKKESNEKSKKVLFEAPPCLFERNAFKYLSLKEECNLPDFRNDVRQARKDSHNRELTKLKSCSKCKLDRLCEGIFVEYLNAFGGREFKPLINTKLSGTKK